PSSMKCPSTRPRQPSRTPTIVCPRVSERRVTARITAFRPGQSPPPVRTPTLFAIDLTLGLAGRLLAHTSRELHGGETDAEGGSRTRTGQSPTGFLLQRVFQFRHFCRGHREEWYPHSCWTFLTAS